MKAWSILYHKPKFWWDPFPRSSQTPDPVNILIVFPIPCTAFWSNPESQEYPDWRSRGNKITTITGTRPRKANSIPLPQVKSFITQSFSTLCNSFTQVKNAWFCCAPFHDMTYNFIILAKWITLILINNVQKLTRLTPFHNKRLADVIIKWETSDHIL